MGKLTLFEKVAAYQAKAEMVPLKGRVKITLSDALTGKVTEEMESSNLITNAVPTFLANNFAGMADFSKSDVAPLYKLFSGVLLFKNTLTESADNFNIPSDADNQCFGWAGDEMHNTANPYRGNPNAVASDSGPDFQKFVWDFSPEQGNGNISAVCLCPGIMGNMGTKPFDDTLNVFKDVTIGGYRSSNSESFSDSNYIKYPVAINADGFSGKAIWIDGSTFTETQVLHNFNKISIMRAPDEWEAGTSRTATIRTITNNKVFFFQDSGYYYVCHITGAAAIQIDKIDKTDMTVTTMDISGLSDVNLWQGTFFSYNQNRVLPVFPYDGTYLYLPNSDNSGAYGINISTPADVKTITGPSSHCFYDLTYDARVAHIAPVVISPGFVWMGSRLLNHNVIYPIAQPANPNANGTEKVWYSSVRNGAALFVSPRKISNDYSFGPAACMLGTFLSTINNLPSSLPKNNTRYMRIEYTLTQV